MGKKCDIHKSQFPRGYQATPGVGKSCERLYAVLFVTRRYGCQILLKQFAGKTYGVSELTCLPKEKNERYFFVCIPVHANK